MSGFADTDGNRFPGDFTLAASDPAVQPTPAQQAYLGMLASLLDWLALLNPAQARFGVEKGTLRTRVAQDLRTDAQNFIAGRLDAETAFQNVLISKGRYLEGHDAFDRPLFEVKLDPETGLANDLRIEVAAGEIEPGKAQLLSAVTATLTVLRSVHDQQKRRKSGIAEEILNRYVTKLRGVSRVGLQGNQAALAMDELLALQRDYFALQAPRVKTRYVTMLFLLAASFAAILLSAYFYVAWHDIGATHPVLGRFLMDHKQFLLLAAGAAIGTWLSFSSRSVTLTFNDLGALEGRLRGAFFLILFATGFTVVIGLLFTTGAISVGLGNLESARLGHGSISLLIGIFCGLSERGLATAVSGRAATFVQGVGGTV